MGELNPMRKNLKRLFAECDRQDKEFEEWEWKWKQKQRSKEKEPVVKETVSETDRRIVRRSHSDNGVERVYIAGYHRSLKYMIAGVASTPTIDGHNEVLLPLGCQLHIPVPLLWRHARNGGGAIGEVVFMHKDDKGISIRAALFTNEASQFAWKKIVLGELSGLSVGPEGPFHMQAEIDGVKCFDRWSIKEVSITPEPANPDCSFKIYTPGKTL